MLAIAGSTRRHTHFHFDKYMLEVFTSGEIKPISSERTIFQAREQARKVAFEKGKQQLARLLNRIVLDEYFSVQEFLAVSPGRLQGFQQIFDHIEVVSERVNSKEVSLHLRLYLMDHKQNIFQINQKPKENLFNLYLSHQETNQEFPGFRGEAKTPYTGLIIDFRGSAVQPSLFPKIWDESGVIIYEASMVTPKYITHHGLVQYTYSLIDAKKQRRVGINPYYAVPISIFGHKYRCNPVILRKHSEILFSHPDTRKALKQGRVIFIIDKPN